jgi:hypothetical protein
MANELTYSDGLPVTLHFTGANIVENATTGLTFTNGGAGLKVPTGYAFHPIMLHGESNADVSAGTAIFKVTANTTAGVNTPTATLSDLIQVAVGVQRPGVEPIAAGKIVGVSVVADANFAPNTADMDAVLVGVLLPA